MRVGEFKVVLWELKVVVDLGPGDLLFFPDSLIHYSNEPVIVKGERHSVVAFTQENMFDYREQVDHTFRDKKNLHLGKRKEKEKRIMVLRKKEGKKALRKVGSAALRRSSKTGRKEQYVRYDQSGM